MGVFMLVGVPVVFIGALAAFLIWTIRKDDINRNNVHRNKKERSE